MSLEVRLFGYQWWLCILHLAPCKKFRTVQLIRDPIAWSTRKVVFRFLV